jgi:hypothetical protein
MKKMELIESSETSAISNQTPGKHPKENTLQIVFSTKFRTIHFTAKNLLSYKTHIAI